MFCGLPGQGIHKTRMFGLAFWDVVASVIAAMVLNRYVFKTHGFLFNFIVIIIVGIVAHRVMKIDTKVNHMIFN